MAKPNGSLDEAFRDLVRAQAALTRAQSELLSRQGETDRLMAQAERQRIAFELEVRQSFAHVMQRIDELETRLVGKLGFGKTP